MLMFVANLIRDGLTFSSCFWWDSRPHNCTVTRYWHFNRKQYHSNNTEIVFNVDYIILDLVAKWPGSTHGWRILSESGPSCCWWFSPQQSSKWACKILWHLHNYWHPRNNVISHSLNGRAHHSSSHSLLGVHSFFSFVVTTNYSF